MARGFDLPAFSTAGDVMDPAAGDPINTAWDRTKAPKLLRGRQSEAAPVVATRSRKIAACTSVRMSTRDPYRCFPEEWPHER